MKPVFIHIPKNGGMTIRQTPKTRNNIIICSRATARDESYRLSFEMAMAKFGRPNLPYEHMRWKDLNEEMKRRKAFAIIRNPWSRVVSRYTYAVKTDAEWDKVEINGKVTGGKEMTFDEFLDQRFQYETPTAADYSWHLAIKNWFPAHDHVSDEEGNVRCEILRFEHYDDDVNSYFGFSNEKFPIRNISNGDYPSHNKKVLKGKRDYKDFYNERQIQIVADWYKKDIDYWGFDFDTAATKNTKFK